ncbi:MAG: hypothetical protein NTW62_01600 [Candidatus Nomurabacteria bacterium]|nr:hypothetical protein [Candidatus Nomurabacteria bacterium]
MNKLNFKFLFSGLLMVFVLISPKVSFATAFPLEQDGSIDNPYIITSCEQLQAMQDFNSSYFKIEGENNAIDCSATSGWNDNGDGGFYGFLPITNFTGTLDGNNNTITGLYINRPDQSQIGVFGIIDTANIHDVTLTGENIIGNEDVGGLIGYANGSTTLNNITTSGTVSGYNGVGGIVGNFYIVNNGSVNFTETFSNLHSSATVHADDYVAGGLFGYLDDQANSAGIDVSFTNSSYNGSSVDSYGEAGGIIGETSILNTVNKTSSHTFSGLTAEGNISATADNDSGGLFGYFYFESDSNSTINLTANNLNYNSGTVDTDDSDAGGVFGYLILDNYSSQALSATFSDIHSKGNVEGGDNLGGLVGDMEVYSENHGKMNVSFSDSSSSDGTVNGNSNIGGLFGYADLENQATRESKISFSGLSSSEDVQGSSRSVGGLFGQYYSRTDNDGILTTTLSDSSYDSGTISSGGNNVGGIIGYANLVNNGTQLMTNTFSGLSSSNVLSTNQSYAGGIIGYLYEENDNSGDMTTVFKDSYHNTGEISAPDNVGGLVGYMEEYNYTSHEMTNMFSGLHSNSVVSSNDNGYYIGGLFGYIYSDNEDNGKMTMSLTDSYHNTGAVSGDRYVGGVAGYVDLENFSYQLMTNTFSGLHSNSAVSSTTDDSDIGGLFGYFYTYSENDAELNTSLTNSYHEKGEVSGNYGVGGLIGEAYLENSSSSQPSTNTFSGLYATSDVTSTGECAGGLIGCFTVYNDNYDTNSSSISFTNSYYNDGIVSGSSYVGGIIGWYGPKNYSVSGDVLSTFSGLHSNAKVNANDNDGYHSGGLIGQIEEYNDGDGGTMHTTLSDSYHEKGLVYAYTGDVGGLVGTVRVYNDGSDLTSTTFSKLYNTSDVTADQEYGYTGGLFGYFWNESSSDNTPITLNNSYYAGGTVTGTVPVGGLVGWLGGADISNSYSSGKVISNGNTPAEPQFGPGGIGGLIGETYGSNTISNSFSTVNTSSTVPETNIAGILGSDVNRDTSLVNNFYSGNENNCFVGIELAAPRPEQCSSITSDSYFFNTSSSTPLNTWDFNSIWYKYKKDYPKFTKEKIVSHGSSSGSYVGGGSSSIYIAPPVQPVVPIVTPSTTPSVSNNISEIQKVTKDLFSGMTDGDVKVLQEFLMSQNKGPASVSLKNHGTTSFFGKLTKAALSEWQGSNNIVPAVGYFGPKTRALIKLLNL